ncbi:hypothetical protein ACH4L7_30065 [Streptomyces anulatus]
MKIATAELQKRAMKARMDYAQGVRVNRPELAAAGRAEMAACWMETMFIDHVPHLTADQRAEFATRLLQAEK